MIVLWLLTGIAAVSVAYFLPGNSPELWPGLNAAAIPLILYLLALFFYTLRNPITRKARIIAWAAILLVGAADAWSWVGMDEETHWQHDQLIRIREVIVRGIMQSQIPDALLKTLETYYQQGPQKKETLLQVFQRLNQHVTVGTNLHKPDFAGDSLAYIVRSLSDNQIVVLGLHTYCTGKRADFKNYNGLTGMVQVKCTLTEKGLTYESEN